MALRKFFFLLVALVLCSAMDTNRTDRDDRHVLLTAFEPFGGAKENGSQLVAEIMQGLSGRDGVQYHICILPVVYDKGAEVAKKCFADLGFTPNLVISAGEAGCDMRLEVRANNLDNDGRDNDGNDRSWHEIAPGEPYHEWFQLPAGEMFCSIPEADRVRERLRVSTTPGNYVCNNTAYHLTRFFKKEKLPFGFIHLPNSRCKNARVMTAGVLHDLVLAALGRPKQLVTQKCLDSFAAEVKRAAANDGSDWYQEMLKRRRLRP